jgi:plasmid stability protein
MGAFYLRDLPDDLQRAFRILCAEEGTSMNKKIRELMAEYIRKTVEAQMKKEWTS